ncbi:MAG: tetratricopeptide repeat protein [Flavobacteriales bacterium]|nr:tetratricopeptide repeat protein [Flavobacteriales bacterium]
MKPNLYVIAFSVVLFFGSMVGCNTPAKEKEKAEELAVEAVSPEIARLDSLTDLLERAPSDAQLLNERAKVFLDLGQLDLAIADVGRALLLDSTQADFFLTISDVYFRSDKPKQCLTALKKAHQLQPENSEPLYRLAQFQLYLQNHRKSIDYANDMLKIDAQDDRPFMIKGLCYKELGDTAKAIHNYLEAVTENPDNYDAYTELGKLHWALGDPLAEQYLKSALSIRTDAIDALYALGMFYQDADRLNDALKTYTRILEIDSTFRSAYFNMGYIQYQYLQLYSEALVNFDKAVKIDPQYFQAIYMRGLCYEAKGDVMNAKREYGYAIEVKPNYAKAAEGLNRILSKVPS